MVIGSVEMPWKVAIEQPGAAGSASAPATPFIAPNTDITSPPANR